MNSYQKFLNLSVALVLAIGIDSNIAFAMGNKHDNRSMDENAQYECSPSKQQISTTAKSPRSDLSYHCTPLSPSEKIKNQGVTSAKNPKTESRNTINHNPLNSSNSSNSSQKSTWDDDLTDQRAKLFHAP